MSQDPIAPHSAGISAYMSVHSATNLAYVRYFAGKDSAVSATFKSINARGFTVEYQLPDGITKDAFIDFKTPLTKREEIRPVLEGMAKEAEEALGLPSSLSGPPPIAAIAKSVYATATDSYTPPSSEVPLDTFYPCNTGLAVAIVAGMGAVYYFSVSTPEDIKALPLPIQYFHKLYPHHWYPIIWKAASGIHVAEGVVALGICLRRGWYSPVNVAKWTISTLLFGFGSMKKLMKHGREVRLGIKKD
ncbi:hypothetical protein K450DRAFT_255775 [Umbelopsis ramanniana AG]|uniref:DUF2470 domain-containing protein n=1 Tax=Umbelopsis ramanniana AG TaxID=1314678 RepID=A0AAD5E5G4_UMBRA|nr:uncharacterized protein K450DRAFT_255775 [Umbelopsis ramanniana AG]KAI8576710.1 hypothetical protein K450DRAFT_255775 [Umbelopsis ramanniana AG]